MDSPPGIELQQVIGEAVAFFVGNQPAAAGAFYQDRAERLGMMFGFADLGVATRADGTLVWLGRRGSRGGVDVMSLQGHESDLLVEVDAMKSAGDARAILRDVWRELWALSRGKGPEANAVPNLDDVAHIVEKTTAIVVLPRPFDELFPLAGELRDAAMARVAQDGMRNTRGPQYKFSIELSGAVENRQIARNFVFEPRANTMPESRVYFTQSPLPPREHVALLGRLVASAK